MRNVFTPTPTLDNPGDYPNDAWHLQRAAYWEYWYHFDGLYLDEKVAGTYKYPLRLNVYNMPCLLHAGFLFGEVPDGNDPLVPMQVEVWGEGENNNAALGRKLTELLARVWYENDGRALQQEAGIISQITGGCVLSVYGDSSLEKENRLPIRIDQLLPEYFFPVWKPMRYWELLEAIVVFEISKLQATGYGVTDVESDKVLYQEHWKETKYEITVDGKPIEWPPGSGVRQSGPSPGVPYTYIPHIRVGEFYGISLLAGKQELAQEVNARLADLGDIIGDSARTLPAIWNTRQPYVRRPGRTTALLDLGNTIPGHNDPGIKYPSGIQTNTAATEYASSLLNVARGEAYTPPVVYGLDEGSQRSALTLALRMIPLIVHIRQERALWSTGLSRMARQILTIAARKDVMKIKPADIKNIKVWPDWAPILPRDREQLINEILLRLNSGLLSPERALKLLGDVPQIKTEMGLIRKWMEYKASLEAQQSNPFGGAGSQGEQAGWSRPEEPQPNLEKEE